MSAACFAREGHEVVGVDVSIIKTQIINQGNRPIVETSIAEIISQSVSSGCLRATTDSTVAIQHSDISLVCVGSNSNGSLDLRYVKRVCHEIGTALKSKDNQHVVVIRSTMLPGTIRDTVVPVLEKASGKISGEHFAVCINPEFLREGCATNLWVVSASPPLAFPKILPNDHSVAHSAGQ